MTASAAVTVAVAAAARVGEGPVWDHRAGELLWVDILAGELHRSRPEDGSTRTVRAPTLIGAAAPRTGGDHVAATAEGFAVVDDVGLDTRAAFLPDGMRMNDAKVAPDGSFWAGSCAMDFAAGRGALHVLAPDWSVTTVLDALTQPNGLGWSPDGAVFYLADTAEHVVRAYDVIDGRPDPDSARDLIRYDDELPDGLCVDAAGALWIALWGGARVEHRDAGGRLLATFEVPVRQPSSCAFAGPGLDRLVVTSAREGLAVDPHGGVDGSVLVIDGTGAQGRPTTYFAG